MSLEQTFWENGQSRNNSRNEDLLQETRGPLLDAINTIIACLALLGNGMVITVMLLRRREFSSFTNRLILHQSVIDSIAGLVFFLYTVVRSPVTNVSGEDNIYDEMVCRFVYTSLYLWCVTVASTYNLVIISLERFMATCYPAKHRNAMSTAKLKIATVTAWAIGLVCGSHFAFVAESYKGQCRVIQMGLGLQIFLFLLTVATEYVLPIIILIYAHTRILITLTKKLANPTKTRNNNLGKAKKDVMWTIFLVCVMFVVCGTPSKLVYILLVLKITFGDRVYVLATGILACNMCVNPIIYCFMYKKFRAQLKDLMLKRLRRN